MALLNRVDALCAPPHSTPRRKPESEEELPDLSDFEAEMQRLSAANQELLESAYHEPAEVAATAVTPSEGLELDLLRRENADLKARVEELEALTSGQAEKLWRERQREYEMLLEEKSEVIRALHQQLQEVEESVSLAAGPPHQSAVSNSRIGQAEEILRLKRELEEQRKQLEQDEEDMMSQLRQMEMQMAKERAEMARQRQEIQRQKAEVEREIENANRNPELKERLKGLRRAESMVSIPSPTAEKTEKPAEQKSGSFFRRIFG